MLSGLQPCQNRRNPQTWNRYAYVGNSPVTYNDPLGLKRDLGWAPGGGGGFSGLYMATGGSSYNNWANTFIQSQMAGGWPSFDFSAVDIFQKTAAPR